MAESADKKQAPRRAATHRGAKDTKQTSAVTVVGTPGAVKCAAASPSLVQGGDNRDSEGASDVVRMRAEHAPGGVAALPCLNSNKCNEAAAVDTLPEGVKRNLNSLSTNHKKTAFKLAKSVARLCSKYGVERIGFLTLTFADHVTCARVAGKRFHSLRTGVLGHRYAESICVLERMKSGRIHFHLLVVLQVDIRTGFNFDLAARGNYSTANRELRAEWAFWRHTSKLYGFGRTELMPVKSNDEGLSKYVGKYIAKHVGAREVRDRGVRLVRYSRGASIGSNSFMFVSPRSKLWRWQVAQFAKKHGCVDLTAVRARFGPRWAYYHRAEIMGIEPPQSEPVVLVGAEITKPRSAQYGDLWWTWIQDKHTAAAALAGASGCDIAVAWSTLYHPKVRPVLEFDVPKWSGTKKVDTDRDFSDVTLITWDANDCDALRVVRAVPRPHAAVQPPDADEEMRR